jgi:cobalamin biosynthesis protein CbiG
MKTAVYALTEKGASLGRSLAHALGAQLYVLQRLAGDKNEQFTKNEHFTKDEHFSKDEQFNKDEQFTSLPDCIARTFHAYEGHIFITAAGIAVRCIAPHLLSKTRDPAVVVLDQQGRFVVSLLSGHLGGANALAERIAELSGATPVITTATDTEGLPSVDMLAEERGLRIVDPKRIAGVNAAILEGRPVPLYDPDDALGTRQGAALQPFFERLETLDRLPDRPWVALTRESAIPKAVQHDPHVLLLCPRAFVVGVGCRRGASTEAILSAVHGAMHAAGLGGSAPAALASIDAKADEPGLLEAAAILDVEFSTFSAEELSTVDVPNPSETVRKHMGVDGVCEAAALKAANTTTLLLPKRVHGQVTTAIAYVEKR